MPISERRKTTLGFVLATILIALAMILSNLSTSKYIDDTEWVVHTIKVRNEIQRLTTLLMSEQNYIRGYHISEQNDFLDQHYTAREELHEALDQLDELTADNHLQQENLKHATALIREKEKAWDNSVDRHRTKGFAAIKARIQAPEAKEQDVALYGALKAMSDEEDRLFQLRLRNADEQGGYAAALDLAGDILAAFLIIGAGLIVYRDSRRREQAEGEIDRFFTLSLDLLCVSGMDGYFKRLSPSYADTLGYSLKELYSRPITDFVHPDDIQKTNDEIASQMQGHNVLAFENRFRRKDGTYRTFSWKSVPVGDYMYAIARDVTDQKKYEHNLLEARTAAQNADVAKSAFIANMSHEIRTPLNGVVGMTDLLARTELKPEQKGFVDIIRSSANILLTIVNEILDFSKIEAGRVALDKSHFDLRRLIESRISLMGVLVSEKDLKLESFVDPNLPPVVVGDSGKVGQVLVNLLNNAVKFTSKGTIKVAAHLLSQSASECVVKIQVQDSGIGIKPEEVGRLFKPFMQADDTTARKFGGTGLGLSISKRFVEVMGGEIGVESKPGEGSTFWFTLKLEVSALKSLERTPHRADAKKDQPKVAATPAQLEMRKNIRVLIAEDNRINQVIVMNMMKALGYTATLVENGDEAVKAFQDGEFDIILMDQHMPVMDGLEATAKIRRIEKQKGGHARIIAFTANVLQDEQKSDLKDLMDDFIIKPVTIETLESVLARHHE